MGRIRKGGTVSFTYELEPADSDYDGDPIELQVSATVSDYDPGQLSGPPENCYPPEGGEVEDLTAVGPGGVEWNLSTLVLLTAKRGPRKLESILEELAFDEVENNLF